MTINSAPSVFPSPVRLDCQTFKAELNELAKSGFFRHALPADVGGLGDGFSDLLSHHYQLGNSHRNAGFILAVNAHLWGAVFPIFLYGDALQRTLWLPKLMSGDWLAGHAITEPGCGSDVQAMQCEARLEGVNFVLNGEKKYITNVPFAECLVVYAKLKGKISAFLLSSKDSGCHFSDDASLDACRGSVTGSVYLNDCRLNANRLLGKPGAGSAMIQKALEYERAFVFAGIAGIMEWQLQEVIRYSRSRQSGGVHLGRHQAISHRIADMKLRLDTLLLWLNECARLCDTGKRLTLVSSQTKLYAAEAFLQSSLDAVQIFGAKGLETPSTMLELVQDALAGRLFSGSSEMQKNLIAALLGTGEAFHAKKPELWP